MARRLPRSPPRITWVKTSPSFGNGSCVLRPRNVSGAGILRTSRDIVISSRIAAFCAAISEIKAARAECGFYHPW